MVDNVVFDGVRVDVNGPYKTGPVIRRSVFVNRVGDGETPAANSTSAAMMMLSRSLRKGSWD